MSSFLRNSAKMAGGAALAQAIPVLMSPLFTRLYSAEEYGTFSAFVAVSGLLAIAYTLRLDLAIMLAKHDATAIRTMRATFSVVLCGMLLTLVMVSGLHYVHPAVPVLSSLGSYALLLPVAAGLLAVFNVLVVWLARKDQFGISAIGAVSQQSVFGAVAVSMPVVMQGNGLVIGRLLGNAASCLYIFRRSNLRPAQLAPTGRGWRRILSLYRQFPFFNLPYSLIGAFARDLLVLAFVAFGQLHVAGLLGLARNMLNAPVYLVSRAFGQVFYREAARKFGSRELEALFFNMMFAMSRAMTPLLVVFIFFAEPVFGFVFGDEWREAGTYAVVLAPAIFLFLFTSWPERLYEVARKQNVSFVIQLGFDLLNVALVVGLLQLDMPVITVLAGYGIVLGLQQLAYLSAIGKIAGFSTKRLLYWMAETGAICAIWFLVVTLVLENLSWNFSIATISVMVTAWISILGRRMIHSYREAKA